MLKLGPVPRKFNSGLNQILVFLARTTLDCTTVGFFLKISKKKKAKRGVRVLGARSTRASHNRRGVSGERKKTDCPFS